MRNIFVTLAAGAALVACSQIPKEAYFTRGSPENLIDASSEVVNLKIDSPSSIEGVTDWINRDQPTRAKLNCSQGDRLCAETQNVLHQFGVPVEYVSGFSNTVTLVYDRIQVRDCQNRYIDNMINPYNLNHPSFGCSVSSNMVQMVSDKRQFTNPMLMDERQDALKATQTAGFASRPADFTPSKVDTNFQAIATQENISSSDGGGSGGGGR